MIINCVSNKMRSSSNIRTSLILSDIQFVAINIIIVSIMILVYYYLNVIYLVMLIIIICIMCIISLENMKPELILTKEQIFLYSGDLFDKNKLLLEYDTYKDFVNLCYVENMEIRHIDNLYNVMKLAEEYHVIQSNYVNTCSKLLEINNAIKKSVNMWYKIKNIIVKN